MATCSTFQSQKSFTKALLSSSTLKPPTNNSSLYEMQKRNPNLRQYVINKKIIFKKDDLTKEEIIFSICLPKYKKLDQRSVIERSRVALMNQNLYANTKEWLYVFFFENPDGVHFKITYDDKTDLFLIFDKFQYIFTTGETVQESLPENQPMILIQKFFVDWLAKLDKKKPYLKQWLKDYTLEGKFLGEINFDLSYEPKEFQFLYLLKKDMNNPLHRKFTTLNKTFADFFGVSFLKYSKTKYYSQEFRLNVQSAQSLNKKKIKGVSYIIFSK